MSDRGWYASRERHCDSLKSSVSRLHHIETTLINLTLPDRLPSSPVTVVTINKLAEQARFICSQHEQLLARFQFPDEKGGYKPGARVGVVGLENAGKSAFLSAWAAKMKQFLPVSDERCTGTSCRLHHRSSRFASSPTNSVTTNDGGGSGGGGGTGFTALVYYRSSAQFVSDIIHPLCRSIGIDSSSVTSLHTASVSFLQGQLSTVMQTVTNDGVAYEARHELSNILKYATGIAQSCVEKPTAQVISSASALDFAQLIRQYIDLEGPYPRAVDHVDIFAELTGLDEGIELMDLPGINSPSDQVNNVTLSQLSSLDLILFLHDATVPQLTGPSQMTLSRLKAAEKQVIFIATAIDKPACITPPDQATGSVTASRSCTPIRVVQNLFKLFPDFKKQDIHCLSAFWYCDNVDKHLLDAKATAMLNELHPLLDIPSAGTLSQPDGMSRLLQRIQMWCSTDLARSDAYEMEKLRDAEQKLLTMVGGSSKESLLNVLREEHGSSRMGVKTGAPMLVNGTGESDPDCLRAKLIEALNPEHDQVDESEADHKRIDDIVSFVHLSLSATLSYESIRDRLLRLRLNAFNGMPFNLSNFEIELRWGACQHADEEISKRLQREHDTMISAMLLRYIERYKLATYQTGCLANILQCEARECRDERKVLEAELERAYKLALTNYTWVQDVKKVVALINGIAPANKVERDQLFDTINIKQCIHHAKALSFNKTWQLQQLFCLPWHIHELDEISNFPLTSVDWVLGPTDWKVKERGDKYFDKKEQKEKETPSQLDIIVRSLHNRVQNAIVHITEIIRHNLETRYYLSTSRNSARQTLFNQLTQKSKRGGEELQGWSNIEQILILPHIKDILFPGTEHSAEKRAQTANYERDITTLEQLCHAI